MSLALGAPEAAAGWASLKAPETSGDYKQDAQGASLPARISCAANLPPLLSGH